MNNEGVVALMEAVGRSFLLKAALSGSGSSAAASKINQILVLKPVKPWIQRNSGS